MNKFDKLYKIAIEEFGIKIKKSSRAETFESIFGTKLIADKRKNRRDTT